MLNYQKYHYNQYRVLLEDGTELTVSREECFASGEAPTEDNPYRQRWYYSPDHVLAIRLPRNKDGENAYLVNAADLRGIEREETRKRSCVGEFDRDMCPVTCAACRFQDDCISECRDCDGHGCKRKCEDCSFRTSRFHSMDKPVSEDDSGDPITEEFDSGADIEGDYCQQETDMERIEALRGLVSTLSEDDQKLCLYIRKGLSNVRMAELLGITEGAVRKRRKKLARLFEETGLKKFL